LKTEYLVSYQGSYFWCRGIFLANPPVRSSGTIISAVSTEGFNTTALIQQNDLFSSQVGLLHR